MNHKNTESSRGKPITIGKVPPQELIHSKRELYEVLRVEDGIPLFIADHLLRLKTGFEKLGASFPFPEQELTQAIYQLIKTKTIKNDNIKISCFIDKQTGGSYYVYTVAAQYPDANMYAHGVQTVLLYAERENPNIKIGHTQVRIKANAELQEKNKHEVLLVDHDGLITEGSRSNVFFIVKDIIYTAPSHMVLPGIMRKKVLDLITTSGLNLKMECLSAAELHKVSSAFITGTSPRILPIRHINEIALDVNNPILRELMGKLNDMIEGYKNNH